MTTVTIDEPVAVLAAFAGGELRPLRFRWQARSLRVQGVNGHWREGCGEDERLHFSVQSGDETYFLHLCLRDLHWRLDRMIVA